jgi:ArsR family transcriptional regulator, lead/cadmium/zinc/bismuth-responsive transcriptional repressor
VVLPVTGIDRFHLAPARVAALKTALLSESSVGALADTFKLLGDSTRVRILDALSRSELCVRDIARLLGLSESAVSHQLRLLRGLRLVRPRRDGRMIFYTLDDQHIVRLFEQGLEHVEESHRRAAGGSSPHRSSARRVTSGRRG